MPARVKAKKGDGDLAIAIPRLETQVLEVHIEGTSPLISHKWSQKAKQMLLDKQQQKARGKKGPKEPEKDFEESIYYDEEGDYAMPAVAFKAACVLACSQVESVTKVLARGCFFVQGEFVKIHGTPVMREDPVRLSTGTADIHYRAQYWPWSATLRIEYNKNAISAEQLVHLVDIAGFSVGIGDWRPGKGDSGTFGRFRVKREEV